MTSTMRRLASGETLHIRTGVIQGIGPQGPRGATGRKGDRGETGAQGMPGPTGYVDESVTTASGSGTTETGVTTIAAFSTLTRDEGSIYTNSSTFTLPTGGWAGTVWVRFTRRSGVNSTGTRRVEATLNGSVIAAVSVAPPTDNDCDIVLPIQVKVTSGSTLQIRLLQTDGGQVAYTATANFNRIGAGIQGPVGPQGPQGPPGPTGAAGPAGPAGTLSTTTTFAQIGGS